MVQVTSHTTGFLLNFHSLLLNEVYKKLYYWILFAIAIKMNTITI
jgi:hypothetical protein